MLCLTRQLADAKATLDLLASGGPDVADRALSAMLALPSVAPCSDVAAPTAAVAPPATDAVRVQVAGARAMLDGARAKRRLGRYADGLEVARPALAAARASGYAPAIGEALLVTGMLENDAANKASIATLREAMHTAAAAGDSATMLDASAWLIYALTNDTDQYAVADEIASLADALAAHAHPPPEIRVRLDNTIALLAAKRGKFDAAQARYEQALALATTELGPDHPGTLTTLNQLGNLAKQQGRFADARTYRADRVAEDEAARTLRGTPRARRVRAVRRHRQGQRGQGLVEVAPVARRRRCGCSLAMQRCAAARATGPGCSSPSSRGPRDRGAPARRPRACSGGRSRS